MTKRAAHTEAQIRRNIKAAIRAGLRIAAIRPDGWIIVHDGVHLVPAPDPTPLNDSPPVASKWSDVEV
jgi:hypothetical protein